MEYNHQTVLYLTLVMYNMLFFKNFLRVRSYIIITATPQVVILKISTVNTWTAT